MKRFWRRLRRRRKVYRGCRACGLCCEMYAHTLKATEQDLARWEAEGRLDLVLMAGEDGTIWIDRTTGEKLEDCPFFRRTGPESAICRIHETKPEICRAYPTREHNYRCLRGLRIHDT